MDFEGLVSQWLMGVQVPPPTPALLPFYKRVRGLLALFPRSCHFRAKHAGGTLGGTFSQNAGGWRRPALFNPRR